MFSQGSAEPAVGAASEPVEVEQVDRLVTYEEQHEGPGEEPLPPESDMFYDTGAPSSSCCLKFSALRAAGTRGGRPRGDGRPECSLLPPTLAGAAAGC